MDSYPDLKKQISKNYLLQTIAHEEHVGYKSIKCACGLRTALLENPNFYHDLLVDKIENVFKLIDVRYVDQKHQYQDAIERNRDALVTAAKGAQGAQNTGIETP